jgi:hypothetical protein
MTRKTAVEELVLRYSHNIVEHLGLKLYQNQPTRVIAELVSNAWDADADENHIVLNMEEDPTKRWVAVYDNGHGMTRPQLTTNYLVIGHPKRAKPNQTSPLGRALMGRKGIGKLAAFGIARYVDVVTAAKDSGGIRAHWLRFDRNALLGKGEEDHIYRPLVIADGIEVEDLPLENDVTGQVHAWRDLVTKGEGVGTAIVMSELSLSRAISESQLRGSVGSRFTVAASGKMQIIVNGEVVTNENSLPKFEFRIPEEGSTLCALSDGREIKYWIGFVESASWPQDQAGIGVYAHGKIAQDRPFVFGLKGREIYTRYMFGVVEADWLDELDKDIISTDRTSVNWEIDEVAALHDKGQALTRDAIAKFAKWRETKDRDEAADVYSRVRARGVKVTPAEESEIIGLAAMIAPSFGKGRDDAKEKMVGALADAWVQKPMRQLVKDLWTSFSANEDAPPEAFTNVIERLSAHSVPESLNLSVVFAQRAFALTRLQDYVLHGSETDLQRLIERFPWIIEPDTAVLTANKTLKAAVGKAVGLGQIPSGRRVEVAGVSDNKKPDFVFLSSPKETHIVVVELKNPQEDLTIDNRAQLHDYMTWMEAHYVDARIRGYLVGRSSGLKSYDTRVSIVPWTEVLARARDRNLELLSAMLLMSGATDDARAVAAIDLGGAEAEALLERLAKDHHEIAELMRTFRKVPKSDSDHGL